MVTDCSRIEQAIILGLVKEVNQTQYYRKLSGHRLLQNRESIILGSVKVAEWSLTVPE